MRTTPHTKIRGCTYHGRLKNNGSCHHGIDQRSYQTNSVYKSDVNCCLFSGTREHLAPQHVSALISVPENVKKCLCYLNCVFTVCDESTGTISVFPIMCLPQVINPTSHLDSPTNGRCSTVLCSATPSLANDPGSTRVIKLSLSNVNGDTHVSPLLLSCPIS